MPLHISIAAETIGHFVGLPITNALLTTWIVMGAIILFALTAARSFKMVPGTLQLIAELLIGGLYDFFKSITGEDKIKELFPLIATIFIFVLVSNWAGLIPGLSAIGFNESGEEHSLLPTVQAATEPVVAQEQGAAAPIEVVTGEHTESGVVAEVTEEKHASFIPLFRGPTADLNTTLALALVSVGSMIFFGIKHLGLGFFKRYLDITNPIMFFVGILEAISDVSKILSFAFRLFGNVFAGEVLLAVMGFLVPVIAPIPFLGLELFVGFIQALVFAMLTAVFINMATTAHGDHKEDHHAPAEVVAV